MGDRIWIGYSAYEKDNIITFKEQASNCMIEGSYVIEEGDDGGIFIRLRRKNSLWFKEISWKVLIKWYDDIVMLISLNRLILPGFELYINGIKVTYLYITWYLNTIYASLGILHVNWKIAALGYTPRREIAE